MSQELSVLPRPQTIVDMMKQRGEQDEAKPALKVISPVNNASINGSTVEVKLDLSGDLKGYMPHKDPATGKGNHIHVILDNQPYEAYYELGQPFELRNVAEGKHTLRVFPSRPWHESFKNDGRVQMVTFTVKAAAMLRSRPPRIKGETWRLRRRVPRQARAQRRRAKAKTWRRATPAKSIRRSRCSLTVAERRLHRRRCDPIMIDFWLKNAKTSGEGGDYRVRYTSMAGAPQFIDSWNPIWLAAG
jgi:hypothetical protein